MPTLLQRNSNDLLATNAIDAPAEPEDNLTRLGSMMAAWGQGKFNTPETFEATLDEFYTKDLIFDTGSANAHGGLKEFKEYSFETAKQWMDFVGGFDITDVATAAIASKDQIWLSFSATSTSKASGRSQSLELLNIYTFDSGKIKHVTVIYANPMQPAYLSGAIAEVPTVVKLPAFEPHPDPKAAYEAMFAAWSAGELAKAETKQASLDKLVHPDAVIDASSAVLPEVFKVYHGHAGLDAWANDVFGAWEIARMDITVETGLKPGCVMRKVEFDAKREGNEVKGIVLYSETAYGIDGRMVYDKIFWANPRMAASLYTD